MRRTRVIRFVSFFKSIIISMFSSTLIYGAYYPYSDNCSQYTTGYACLERPSRLVTGQSECVWEANYNSGYIKCSLRGPPNDFYFIAFVFVLTTLISLPLDVVTTLLLYTVCNRKPDWDWHGSDERYRNEYFQKDQRVIVQFLNELRVFYSNQKTASAEYNASVIRLIRSLGICFEKNGDVALTWYASFYFSSVAECVAYNVRRTSLKALQITREVNGISKLLEGATGMKDTIDTILMHHFMYEQIGLLGTITLQPQLDTFSRRIPLLINPALWLLGWMIVIAVNIFFIVWVLLWGLKNTGLTLNAWIANFLLETVWGCLISSTLRILLMNAILSFVVIPKVNRILGNLCSFADDLQTYSHRHNSTFLFHAISPVAQAAKFIGNSNRALEFANIVTKMSDEDILHIKKVVSDTSDDERRRRNSFSNSDAQILLYNSEGILL